MLDYQNNQMLLTAACSGLQRECVRKTSPLLKATFPWTSDLFIQVSQCFAWNVFSRRKHVTMYSLVLSRDNASFT